MSTAPETKSSRKEIPIREREAVPVAVAAQFIGISRTRVYELMQDGTIEGKIITGKHVVLVESLLRLIGEAPTTTRALLDRLCDTAGVQRFEKP